MEQDSTGATPIPGWYADPSGRFMHRYWDGSAWTNETDQPLPPPNTGIPAPAAGPGWAPVGSPPAPGQFGAYSAPTRQTTPSGMRPVAALFSDTGKMILRGGWQILGVSALIWAVWTIIFALATVLLVNFESLSRALQYWSDALDRYPDGVLPESVNSEFGRLLTQVPSPLPLVGWIAVGIAACAVTLLAVTTQVVAVNKLAMDAAADRPVRFGEAMRSCLGAGTRLAGYALLLIAASAAAIALLVAGTAVTALVSPVLAAVVGTLGFLAFTVLSWWICGRLVPLVAQVVVARGSLKWSWNSTRNKWFAVVGRYLLWYIVAGAVTSIVVMIVVIPLAMAAGISAAAGAGPVGGLLLMIIMYAVMIPIDFALSGVLSAGAVPIWRDLTDDPRYATIQPTARPV